MTSDTVPTVGRIVRYTLTKADADQVNVRRRKARHPDGTTVHVGNDAETGDVCSMMIVRVWGDQPTSAVNGQVFLDGNDVLWVTSRSLGDGEGHWSWPART